MPPLTLATPPKTLPRQLQRNLELKAAEQLAAKVKAEAEERARQVEAEKAKVITKEIAVHPAWDGDL